MAIPSTYEDPKGLSLLESMAAGTPVLAPRRGTYTEIMERTQGGPLLEDGSVEAIVEALFELTGNAGLRETLGRRGFEGVRAEYGARRMAEKAATVYSRLADPAREAMHEVRAG
jgi:glycosyltransferase involved in cell wall biosynthesis